MSAADAALALWVALLGLDYWLTQQKLKKLEAQRLALAQKAAVATDILLMLRDRLSLLEKCSGENVRVIVRADIKIGGQPLVLSLERPAEADAE